MEQYPGQASQIFEPTFTYGGFWERVGAYLIDGIILSIPNFFISWMMGYNMFAGFANQANGSFFTVTWFEANAIITVINWLYFALMESGPGQATLGKRALGLKVIGDRGQRITFANATGRYFGKIVSMIILCIGFLMVAWDDRKQALHDKMAKTFVIKA